MLSRELTFESPSFTKRLRGMLGVDFYRLFNTPMFYIFLAVAAIIPAMILGMTTIETAEGAKPLYDNAWQVLAANSPLYVISDIADYANMNMVFIFGGIMVSIFIGQAALYNSRQKARLYAVQNPGKCLFYGLYVRDLPFGRNRSGTFRGSVL